MVGLAYLWLPLTTILTVHTSYKKEGKIMIDLKKARLDKGWTQDQLAEKVFVVRTTISNIECGLCLPSIPTAKLLAKVLDLDWTEFYNSETN